MKPLRLLQFISPLNSELCQGYDSDRDIFIESFAECKDMGIDRRHVRADGFYNNCLNKKITKYQREDVKCVARKEKAKIGQSGETGAGWTAISCSIIRENLTVEKVVLKILFPYMLASRDIVTGR